MKKKIFLLITYFFLFSSLAIFLTYRNSQFLEIIKKKEGEIKELLEELEGQKEKSSSNQNIQKETDTLPWMFTWKGTILSLTLSIITLILIIIIIVKPLYSSIIKMNLPKKEKNKFESGKYADHFFVIQPKKEKNELSKNQKDKIGAIFCTSIIFIFIFFYLFFFPAIFAIRKYKNKSYWERFWLANFSSLAKNIFNGYLLFIIVIFVSGIFLCPASIVKNHKQKNNYIINDIIEEKKL